MGQALLQCVVAAGPPGAYNIAADGIVTAPTLPANSACSRCPLPAGPAQVAARAFAALPFLPPVAQWVEAASHPAIMDTTRAKQELGWAPRFTALETLRDTLRRRSQPDPPAMNRAAHLFGRSAPRSSVSGLPQG